MFWFRFLAFCIAFQMVGLFCGNFIAPLKRPKPIRASVSIIVPCVGKHFKYIGELLNNFGQQSKLPNEIVISVSQVDNIVKKEIYTLRKRSWPFRLIILAHSDKKSAGENRNIACQNAHGDIYICQDADDLPHPQRVEMIKYIFENYYADILMHGYTGYKFDLYDKNNLVLKRYKQFKDISVDAFAQGNVAISKEVFKKVQWPTHFGRGEDRQFNRQVCNFFEHIVSVRAELLLYRAELSSWKKRYQLLRKRLLELKNEVDL